MDCMIQPSEIPIMTLPQLRGLFRSRKKQKQIGQEMTYEEVKKLVRQYQGRE